MYLVYRDEKGWKIARQDGRLDEFTKYYESYSVLEELTMGVMESYKVIENDQPVLSVSLH